MAATVGAVTALVAAAGGNSEPATSAGSPTTNAATVAVQSPKLGKSLVDDQDGTLSLFRRRRAHVNLR